NRARTASTIASASPLDSASASASDASLVASAICPVSAASDADCASRRDRNAGSESSPRRLSAVPASSARPGTRSGAAMSRTPRPALQGSSGAARQRTADAGVKVRVDAVAHRSVSEPAQPGADLHQHPYPHGPVQVARYLLLVHSGQSGEDGAVDLFPQYRGD